MESDSRIEVGVTDPASPSALRIVERFWQELGTLYGNTGPCEYRPEDVSGEGSRFVLASRADEALGCGALVPLQPGIGELKRMFVEPSARRLGVAGRILELLECEARALGYRALRLETGLRQPAAVAFYRAANYGEIEAYGRHVEDPLSVCFEKAL